MRHILTLALVAAAAVPSYAADKLIASCHLGQGYSYYDGAPEYLTAKKPEWSRDGWKDSAARLTLLFDGKNYNLIIKDALGTTSAVENGATVIRIENGDPNIFQVLSVYAGERSTVEVFTFVRRPPLPGRVIWTSARTGGSILPPKIGGYVGDCELP